MPVEPTITFRDFSDDGALDVLVRRQFADLERYCSNLMGARVLVEAAHGRHRAGNRTHVRIDLTVPGEQIVVSQGEGGHPVSRTPTLRRTRKDNELDRERRRAQVAVRHAFAAARRRLQDYARRHRGATKLHTPQPEGTVTRLNASEGFGFLVAADGHEVYFHRNSVLDNAFGNLDVGARVAYVEESGDQGPQASTIRLIG